MIIPNNDFWQVFKNVNGALSVTEAVAIMNIASDCPSGNFLECGSFHGKSGMAAAYTLKDGVFYMLDPIFEDVELASQVEDKIYKFRSNNFNAFMVKALPNYSTDFLQSGLIYSYVFVDSGSHQDGLPMQEVKLLEDKMVQGGIIAFHDWNSQFKEVKEASDYLVSTGKYEYIPINWEEIIEYVNANNFEEGNLSWHHQELKNPCFVGAVKRI